MPSYFLGANSRRGFFSLYDQFPPEGSFLHVIKGGPGTGKSTLLKALAAKAEARGLEVHRVLCSGDPDSLDGVAIPALALAWVDGTAPHITEPGLFGVTGDYWNLTRFLTVPFSAGERRELLALQESYRELYREAYERLESCAEHGGAKTEEQPAEAFFKALDALPGSAMPGSFGRRFLSAVTCKGLLCPDDALRGYRVIAAPSAFMAAGAQKALQKGQNAILCPSPLDPDRQEALLLPKEKLAFVAVSRPAPDSLSILGEAVELLRQAKALHDEMEARFRPHMDYAALSEETDRILARLFP